MLKTLKEIVALIGNVNHATKTGANDALFRGQILNDVRTLANNKINEMEDKELNETIILSKM